MKTEKRYLVPGDYMADPAVHVFDGNLLLKMIMAIISI